MGDLLGNASINYVTAKLFTKSLVARAEKFAEALTRNDPERLVHLQLSEL